MANNSYKINKSLNLNPQSSAPANPVDGDIYYDSTIGSFVYYNQGAWANLDSVGDTGGAANMTSAEFTPSLVQNSVIRVTTTSGNLHGMSASFSGKKVVVYNATAGAILVKNESATEATANNRITTPVAADMNLVAGEIASFMYDLDTNRWLLVSVGSGAGAYAPATTATNGIVILNQSPVSAGNPKVPVLDASEQVVAQGLSRGAYGAGAVTIGAGANDSSVRLSKAGAITYIDGSGAISENFSAQNLDYSGTLDIGVSAATDITIGRPAGSIMIDSGTFAVNPIIDAAGGLLTGPGASILDDVIVPVANNYKYDAAVTRTAHATLSTAMWNASATDISTSVNGLASSAFLRTSATSPNPVWVQFRVMMPAGATVTGIKIYAANTSGVARNFLVIGENATYSSDYTVKYLDNGGGGGTNVSVSHTATADLAWYDATLNATAGDKIVTSDGFVSINVGVPNFTNCYIAAVRVEYTHTDVKPVV